MMSSEVENGGGGGGGVCDEEVKQIEKESLRRKLRKSWQIGVKILEIIISSVCLGFFFEPAQITGLGKSDLHHVGVIYTAFAYNLINCILLTGKFLGDRLPYRTSTLFSSCGAALYLISGILLIVDRSDLMKRYIFHPHGYLMVMMTSAIFFAFLNVVVFAVDALCTYKRREDF